MKKHTVNRFCCFLDPFDHVKTMVNIIESLNVGVHSIKNISTKSFNASLILLHFKKDIYWCLVNHQIRNTSMFCHVPKEFRPNESYTKPFHNHSINIRRNPSIKHFIEHIILLCKFGEILIYIINQSINLVNYMV